jgi:hypothetical protein
LRFLWGYSIAETALIIALHERLSVSFVTDAGENV